VIVVFAMNAFFAFIKKFSQADLADRLWVKIVAAKFDD
jgi:hypothetical protein